MSKNILIFSDGTGQAGGLLVDENRSNVYKLYRGTRVGPDSMIDPQHQLAFYDPGLGSNVDGSQIKIGFARKVYNLISQGTGLGITRNIIDCYAAILSLWRPGDRIFLIGFSRGAYTVRCVGGVLAVCGVPTHMKDGSPLHYDAATIRASDRGRQAGLPVRLLNQGRSIQGFAREARISIPRCLWLGSGRPCQRVPVCVANARPQRLPHRPQLVLITATGIEPLHAMPRGFVRV